MFCWGSQREATHASRSIRPFRMVLTELSRACCFEKGGLPMPPKLSHLNSQKEFGKADGNWAWLFWRLNGSTPLGSLAVSGGAPKLFRYVSNVTARFVAERHHHLPNHTHFPLFDKYLVGMFHSIAPLSTFLLLVSCMHFNS